ncbi:MAG: GNAT family N-acetyltransferase [Leptospirales bacterium]|nr:GNAT family N-acetyltransferase [Leptospirales bacterium]
MSGMTMKTARQLAVRLAQNQLEIEETLQLRYNIFNVELQEGLPESHATQKDRDRFDLYCDHLIVVDRARENQIVGTYRLLRRSVAAAHEGFYSQTEFDISGIYDLDGEVAEIGRSCVHPEYRDGSVITHLWMGLAAYMREFNVRYLCGCGSVHSQDPADANRIYAFLREKGALSGDVGFFAKPLPAYQIAGFDPEHRIEDLKAISKQIPPLIKGYIRAGSFINGYPAYDHVFGTTDFFVIFDRTEIDNRYGRHYMNNDSIRIS